MHISARASLVGCLTIAIALLISPAGAGAAGPQVFVTRTGSAVVLDSGGGVITAVESLSLPKGQWTITANLTAVNFGPADFIRCRIDDTSNPLDGGSTTYLAGTVGDLANAATVKASAPFTARLACSHDDDSATGQIYIDPGATLLAVKGGPIQQLTGAAQQSATTPAVVQRRTTASTPLAQNTPTPVTSVSLAAGIWAVRANLSAVSFAGGGFAACELTGPSGQAFTAVDAGHSEDLVSELVVQNVFTLGATSDVQLSCYSVYTAGMYVDPGATLTATLVPSTDVVEGGTGEHALTDAGGTFTTVFQQQMTAGAWRVASVSNAYVKNPNNSIGGSQDFVRCALFAGKKKLDGGATVLLVAPNVGGNFEQQVLDTGTFTAAAAWTLKLKCLHDAGIASGSHWTISLDSPVIAIRKGPIRSSLT